MTILRRTFSATFWYFLHRFPFIYGGGVNMYAQDWDEVLTPNDTTYYQICAKMENHIAGLADTSGTLISIGEAEDDNISRFAKWRNFWRGRVAPDGTMSIFSQTLIDLLSGLITVCDSPIDDDITWRQLGPFNSQGSGTSAKNCYSTGALNTQNQGRIDAVSPNSFDTQDILAGGNNGGIWRTQDGGQTWTNTTADEGYNMVGINKIIRHPQNQHIVFALTQVSGSGYNLSASGRRIYGIGILYSNDGGDTWFRTDNPEPFDGSSNMDGNGDFSKSVTDIGIPPDNTLADSRLYITTGKKLYYAPLNLNSGIGAATAFIWDELYKEQHGRWNSPITGFAIQPSDGSVWITGDGAIQPPDGTTVPPEFKLRKFTYDPITQTHNDVIEPLPSTAVSSKRITLLINSLSQMVLSAYIGSTLHSYHLDLSIPLPTWVGPNISGNYNTLGIGTVNSQIIFAEDLHINERCMYKSTNGGSTFSPMNNFPNHVDKRTLFVLPGTPYDILYLGTDGGVSICTDEYNWEDITGEGIANTNFFGVGITEHNPDFLIGGAQDGSINMYNNHLWYETAPGGDNGDCAISPANPRMIYQEQQNTILKTELNIDGTDTPYITGSYQCTAFCVTSSSFGTPNYYYSPLLFNPSDPEELFFGKEGFLNMVSNATTGIISFEEITNSGLYPANKGNPISNDNWGVRKHLSSIAMANTNPNVAYYSIFGAYWGDSNNLNCGDAGGQVGGIFKSERTFDGSGTATWNTTNITGNMYLPVSYNCSPDPVPADRLPASITDIAVDPNNENRIWVCFDGFVPEYKVFYSENGGGSWSAVTGCFPNIPTSTIAYQPNSPDRIFVGTDAGVFFKDNTMTDWAYYANGGPQCLIADIEINQCDNKMVVATHGSGMWEVDLPDTDGTLTVSTNTTYTSEVKMYENITIATGTTLTLAPGTTLRMAKNKSITIKPGAMLHVNNATITDLCQRAWDRIIVQRGAKLLVNGASNPADPIQAGIITAYMPQQWNGVDVWGNTLKLHSDIFSFIPVPFDAAAYEAAVLSADDPGMVILKNNARIENARTGISTQRRGGDFPDHYGGIVYAENSNFRNNRKAVEMMKYRFLNFSRFNNCVITQDDSAIPFEGITIWACMGVTINQCQFNYNATQASAFDQIGVVTWDASRIYIVNGCKFNNLKFGALLQATDYNSGSTFIGSNYSAPNEFNNCRVGIQNMQTHRMIAENNIFTHTIPTVQHISLVGTCGYIIQNNIFNNGYGVLAFFTSQLTPGNNIIDCNVYNGTIGNYIYDNNEGLRLLNNNFDTTQADNMLSNGMANGSIAFSQGGFGEPVFNLFSTNPSTEHFYSPLGSTDIFLYFYHTDPLYTSEVNSRLVPKCDIASTCTPPNNFVVINTDFALDTYYEGCLDLNGDDIPGILPPGDSECQTEECYQTIKDYWESLKNEIDGGDKQALLNDIYNNPESLATYQKLMDASPYLSDEALKEAANAELMSSNYRANILLANAPLSEDVMYHIQDIVAYNVYQLLYTIKYYTQFSARDQLYANISRQTAIKEEVLRSLLQKYADEKDYLQLDGLLAAENTIYALRTLVSSKMEQGIFTDAQTLLDALPAETPEEQDYKTLQQININRLGNAGFELSESQYQQLKTIADARGYQAPAACSLLSLLRGEYCEWLIPSDAGSGKTAARPRYKKVPLSGKTVLNRLLITPNPANHSFEVQLPAYLSDQPRSIQIVNLSGKTLQSVALAPEQQNINMSTRDLPNGILLVQYTADGIVVAAAKVVVQH